jgi:hypothetical protein
VVDTLVGGVEVSKSKKVQIQITDKSPMIQFDHVDQASVYLAKAGLDVEIVTSCSTGLNVLPFEACITLRFKYRMRRKKEIMLNGLFRKACDMSLQTGTW